MAWLYKRALDDAIGLSSMLVMVLLDDEVYKAQRKALIDYVNTLPPPKEPADLGSAVHNAFSNLAGEWKRRGMAGSAAAFLWKLKQGGIAAPKGP
jgi:hypothetical protein